MRSSCSSKSAMRRRLNITTRRATSVGCAVKTGMMEIERSQSMAASPEMPAARMARSVPRRDPRCASPESCSESRRRLRWLVSARLMSSK